LGDIYKMFSIKDRAYPLQIAVPPSPNKIDQYRDFHVNC